MPAMVAAIERYLDDPDLARRHGYAGRERAVTLFSIDRQARQMAAAIRDIVGAD